jgi:hypothetical protein
VVVAADEDVHGGLELGQRCPGHSRCAEGAVAQTRLEQESSGSSPRPSPAARYEDRNDGCSRSGGNRGWG